MYNECEESEIQEYGAFSTTAPLVSHQPSVRPPPTTENEVVFAADGGMEAEIDAEDLRGFFGDEEGDNHAKEDNADKLLAEPGNPSDDVALNNHEEDDQQGSAHKVLPDPGEPTAAEVEDHRACGHLPYRSWCQECVESRGTGEPHRQRSEQRVVCVFAFDYLSIGKDGAPIGRQDLTEHRDEVDV